MRPFIVLLFLLTFACKSQIVQDPCNPNRQVILSEYDYENLNQEWVKKDTIFVKKLLKILTNNPRKIEETIIDKSEKNITRKKSFSFGGIIW
ncbi:MAG: hypothetical protein GKR88_01915 [Flavobacteriaceae bacterium]|nr:MAG: hypothetical protein GKR88_01915 [Flavobacteriaceae bacterium]